MFRMFSNLHDDDENVSDGCDFGKDQYFQFHADRSCEIPWPFSR